MSSKGPTNVKPTNPAKRKAALAALAKLAEAPVAAEKTQAEVASSVSTEEDQAADVTPVSVSVSSPVKPAVKKSNPVKITAPKSIATSTITPHFANHAHSVKIAESVTAESVTAKPLTAKPLTVKTTAEITVVKPKNPAKKSEGTATPKIVTAAPLQAPLQAPKAPLPKVREPSPPKKTVISAASASGVSLDGTSAEIGPMREGVRSILAGTFTKLVKTAFTPSNYEECPVRQLAVRLEQALFDAAADIQRTIDGRYHTHRQTYSEVRLAVCRCLVVQIDICPDDIVGLMLLLGQLDVKNVLEAAIMNANLPVPASVASTKAAVGASGVGDAGNDDDGADDDEYDGGLLGGGTIASHVTESARISMAMSEGENASPRETIRRMLARTLMMADPRYGSADGRDLAAETARAIEISCYNAAVRQSKASEEPPRRQWDSPAFVDIYSTRCGAVCGLLDPRASSSLTYGRRVVERLLTGELTPDALGEMTERQLCPEATEAEEREIAERSRQRVVEKESTMFKCPHCGERRSTHNAVQRRGLDEAQDYQCLCLNPFCRRRFTGHQ